MDRQDFIKSTAMGGLGLGLASKMHSDKTPSHDDNPNIILILADDLGWNDVGYHGGAPKTPNIDSLANEGLQLDRFYTCPICSPTRSCLLTGRYSIRFGLMGAVIPPWRKRGLPPEEETIAEMLAKGGYQSRAALGKWHLGLSDRKYHPLNQGFTYFNGCYNGAINYFTHQRAGELDWHRNFQPCYDEGYVTHLLTNEATRFIRNNKDDSPFFLYLPYTAVHSPQQVPDRYLKMYPNLKGDRKIHAAMTTAMDEGIGDVMREVKRSGIAENTIVLFMSDNGGLERFGGSNKPLRGQKQQVFEGGVRVPAIAWSPGYIETGKTGFDAPMSAIDILPTLQSITGTTDTSGNPLDGEDLSAIWEGKQTALDRDLFMYWAQHKNEERLATWSGDWKLIYTGPSILKSSASDRDHLYLFNLRRDPYEKDNLISQTAYTDRVKEMLAKLQEFRKLRPAEGMPSWGAGRKGFTAPKNWNMKLYDKVNS